MRPSLVRLMLCACVFVPSAPHAARAQSCTSLQSAPEALAPCLATQHQVEVADLNGDQIPDLAVTTTNSLQIELGSLDGAGVPTYRAAGTYPTPPGAAGIAIADFDSDGIPDIAVACESGGVLVYRGLGTAGVANGTFEQYLNIFTLSVWRVRAADMNGDGILDLVASAEWGALLIYHGTGVGGHGDGGFTFFRNLGSGGSARGFVIADLDDDGVLDIAVASNTPRIEVHKGLGSAGHNNGDFLPIVNVPTGFDQAGLTWKVASCDFNRDGHTDLVVTDCCQQCFSLLAGAGGLAYTPFVRSISFIASSVATGDVDGDGLPDIVLPHTSGTDATMFSAYLNTLDSTVPAGGFPLFVEQRRGGFNWGNGVTLADVNHDGGLDILVAGISSTSLPVFVTHCPPVTGVEGAARVLALAPVRPNPSPGMAHVRCSLPRPGRVRLVILDASGRRIRGLADGEFAAGPHEFTWDGRMDSREPRRRPGSTGSRSRRTAGA